MNLKLSPHFWLSEFVTSQTAERQGIDNTPGPREIAALTALCINVLEPVRVYFASPIVISSGFRCPALNRAIAGSSSSQHPLGEAADFEIPGLSNVEVARWMEKKLNYDQLILEFHTPGDPNSGWIHASWRANYRNQELTASRVRKWGRWSTIYSPGLIA